MAPTRIWSDTIREQIEENMSGFWVLNDDYTFITLEKLCELWAVSGGSAFEELQVAMDVRFNDTDFPFTMFASIISILVMVKFGDWASIGNLLYQGLNDAQLPFEVGQLHSEWFSQISNTIRLARDFVSWQYAFCPIVVEKGRDLIMQDRKLRLPFISEQSLGQGAFGTVTKVIIPKGYLAEHDGNQVVYSSMDTVAARKKFHTASHGRVEQDVLDRLRRETWHISCIMSSFASVNLGPVLGGECEFNLFFEYAPADLHKFLNGDAEAHALLSVKEHQITPHALFTQLYYMIDALRYLHRQELRMCHSDLKLNNILIVRSNNHPIGQWKITDFGIASIEPRAPSQARNWGDVIATTSIKSSGYVPVDDQRRPGPYQPPEVEYPERIPIGTMFRAKGDIWSLGCISVYVLIYALAGVSGVKEMDDLMYASSRPPDRQGYFYQGGSMNTIDLFRDMVRWIAAHANRWDTWAMTSNLKPWVQRTWSKLILPMLAVDLPQRADAQSLLIEVQQLIKHIIPSQNIWDVLRLQPPIASPVQTPSTIATSQRITAPRPPVTNAAIQNRNLHPSSSLPFRSSVVRVPGTGGNGQLRPTAQSRNLISPYRASGSQLREQILPIREEPSPVSNTVSTASTGSGLPGSRSPATPLSPTMLTSNSPGYYDLKQQLSDKCHAVQIATHGSRILMLAASGLRTFVRDLSSPSSWRLEDNAPFKDIFNTTWQSINLGDPFMLLRKRITTGESENRLWLHNVISQNSSYQQEWNESHVSNLASVSLAIASAQGHVAFRSFSKKLAVYNHDAGLLFNWDLSTVDYPDTPYERGNIESMAFDPDGEVLVITAWNCWYLWILRSLRDDWKPSRYGSHRYTQPDTGRSECSLQVIPGGRFFVLHDQCQQNLCICIDTLPNGKVVQFDLIKRPKPHTIAVSPSCDWLAYLVDSNMPLRKDYVYYCRLRNAERDTADTPSIGTVQKSQLSRIKTVKLDHKSVVDAVVRIVPSQDNVYAIIASVTKYIEIIPLR